MLTMVSSMRRDLPLNLKKLYPFEPRYIKLNDGKLMHYIEEGSGETVLFLHGHPNWSFFFRKLIRLMRNDFKCIAIDHIGYGMSDKPWSYEYGIETHIENARQFAEKMRFKKFHIVAQDFGVPVALSMAERWPERISSMSFLNSYSFLLPRLPMSMMFFKLPLVTSILSRLFNFFIRICLHFGSLNVLPDDVIRGYLWPFKNFFERNAIPAGICDMPWLPNNPSLDFLKPISDKAFILCNKKIKFFWAEDDFRYNFDVLQAWANVLPNAKYKMYKLSGHYLLEDSDEAITDIRNFVFSAKNIEKDLFK